MVDMLFTVAQNTERMPLSDLMPLQIVIPYKMRYCDQDVKANGTEAPANETEKIEYETVTKTRKKTIRVPLKISGPGFTLPKLTPEQLKVMNRSIRVPVTLHFVGHCREGSPLLRGYTEPMRHFMCST